MNVEVNRDTNSLTIRWTNENGRSWTVTKAFDKPRAMKPATVNRSGGGLDFDNAQQGRQVEGELGTACWLAERMDETFQRPEDFDRVQIADYHTHGSPAWIIGPTVVGGHILIVTAPKAQERKEP